MTTWDEKGNIMVEANNLPISKSTIADKIHQAVSSLLDTETRLNTELREARELISSHERRITQLTERLNSEQEARRELEQRISRVAEVVNGH